MVNQNHLHVRRMAKVAPFAALSLALTLLAGCATMEKGEETYVFDPLEPVNRVVFAANETLDFIVLNPLVTVYKGLVPERIQKSAVNFFRNLNSPFLVANQALQGDWDGTKDAVMRFALNTTIGVGGLFDFAGTQGYEYELEDLGQTMAVWGIPEGPYLVLPILGPSNLRDGTGRLVEALLDPVNLYLHNKGSEDIVWIRRGAEGFVARAEADAGLKDIRQHSVDTYAAMRSSYQQYRDSLIRDGESEDWHLPVYENGGEARIYPENAGKPLAKVTRQQIAQNPYLAVRRAIYFAQ